MEDSFEYDKNYKRVVLDLLKKSKTNINDGNKIKIEIPVDFEKAGDLRKYLEILKEIDISKLEQEVNEATSAAEAAEKAVQDEVSGLQATLGSLIVSNSSVKSGSKITGGDASKIVTIPSGINTTNNINYTNILQEKKKTNHNTADTEEKENLKKINSIMSSRTNSSAKINPKRGTNRSNSSISSYKTNSATRISRTNSSMRVKEETKVNDSSKTKDGINPMEESAKIAAIASGVHGNNKGNLVDILKGSTESDNTSSYVDIKDTTSDNNKSINKSNSSISSYKSNSATRISRTNASTKVKSETKANESPKTKDGMKAMEESAKIAAIASGVHGNNKGNLVDILKGSTESDNTSSYVDIIKDTTRDNNKRINKSNSSTSSYKSNSSTSSYKSNSSTRISRTNASNKIGKNNLPPNATQKQKLHQSDNSKSETSSNPKINNITDQINPSHTQSAATIEKKYSGDSNYTENKIHEVDENKSSNYVDSLKIKLLKDLKLLDIFKMEYFKNIKYIDKLYRDIMKLIKLNDIDNNRNKLILKKYRGTRRELRKFMKLSHLLYDQLKSTLLITYNDNSIIDVKLTKYKNKKADNKKIHKKVRKIKEIDINKLILKIDKANKKIEDMTYKLSLIKTSTPDIDELKSELYKSKNRLIKKLNSLKSEIINIEEKDIKNITEEDNKKNIENNMEEKVEIEIEKDINKNFEKANKKGIN